ncbi:MAG: hypothetical protein L3J47_04040 [Sulfurovum sp.]|nr:hypothetical protein [Sulfurovum sp.]
MTTTNRKILQALLITDGLLIFVSAAFFGMETLLNTQIGFLSAALVMLASMKSYKRMVDARVEHEIVTMDIDKDVIDKLEDPHDLYSEEVKEEPVEDVRAAIKEEKARMKASKRSLFEILKDTKAALSVYRIGAYLLLVLGFLYLNRHGMLQLTAYLLSLGLPPLLVVWTLLKNKPSDREDAVE